MKKKFLTFFHFLLLFSLVQEQRISASEEVSSLEIRSVEIPTSHRNQKEGKQCPICLENVEEMQQICLKHESHAICREPCLKKFMKSEHARQCPLCRGPSKLDDLAFPEATTPEMNRRISNHQNDHTLQNSLRREDRRRSQELHAHARATMASIERSLGVGLCFGSLCLGCSSCLAGCTGLPSSVPYIVSGICCSTCSYLSYKFHPAHF